jgi:hypothetical protein
MRHHPLRAALLCLIVVAVFAPDASAQGNWKPGDYGSLRFRLGLFEPDGESMYWDDKFRDFTGSPSSFEDFVWGIDYLWRTSRSSGLLFGSSFYDGKTTQAYLDWVDASGREIRHVTNLQVWDITAAFVWRLGQGGVVPYLGAGGGFLYWYLEESGDFIDFGDPDLPIVFARYRASGWTYEGFGMVGLDVNLGYRWSFFVEGRYRVSDDELSDDFAGMGTLDLSGTEFTAGLSWNF